MLFQGSWLTGVKYAYVFYIYTFLFGGKLQEYYQELYNCAAEGHSLLTVDSAHTSWPSHVPSPTSLTELT